MRVPELLLVVGELVVVFFGNHVLDPNQACVLVGGVVDEALADSGAHMRAVMGCLDIACYVMTGLLGVDMEGIEKFADVMERFELGAWAGGVLIGH